MRTVVPTVLCAAVLGACASTGMLRHESARAITPTPYQDSVTVSEVRHHVLSNSTTWVATTPGGVYDCTYSYADRVALCPKRNP